MERYYTNPIDKIAAEDFRILVGLALKEDCPDHDITTESIFSESEECRAVLFSKEEGILCGTAVLEELRSQTGNKFTYELKIKDGAKLNHGTEIAILKGNLRTILRVERLFLNFIQYLSGIASATNRIVEKYSGNLMILDTRKTLPGYRKLVKYAVFTGGGANHRLDLSDMALIKDNHVAMAGSIREAVSNIRNKFPNKKIELEIDSLSQIEEAIQSAPEIIMLDNFSIEDTIRGVEIIRKKNSGIRIECSGGITPEKLQALSEIGGIGVSMGYLTHTTRFMDLSLEIVHGL